MDLGLGLRLPRGRSGGGSLVPCQLALLGSLAAIGYGQATAAWLKRLLAMRPVRTWYRAWDLSRLTARPNPRQQRQPLACLTSQSVSTTVASSERLESPGSPVYLLFERKYLLETEWRQL